MGCRVYTLPNGVEVHAHVADDVGPQALLAIEQVVRAASEFLDELFEEEPEG